MDESAIKPRPRRMHATEEGQILGWRERTASSGEAPSRTPEFEPPIGLRHEPHPLPRRTGFFERLGFGRIKREA